jgi:galacturonosyltransferase 12/13/14/15
VRDLYAILDEINSEEVPIDVKIPESFNEFVWDMKNGDNDLRSFAFKLKAMVSLASIFSFTFFKL